MDTVSELLSKSTTDRFWSKVDKRGPDECWPWLDYCDHKGYGRFNGGTQTRFAHRYAWFFTYGVWPEQTIDHLCNNQGCQNVRHMEDVSSSENTYRRDERNGNPAARTDRCINGHLFEGDNLYINAKGHRICRACGRAKAARYEERRRASG